MKNRRGLLGRNMAKKYPQMFEVRQCRRRDAIRLMNSWGKSKSLVYVSRIAGRLRCNVETLKARIQVTNEN